MKPITIETAMSMLSERVTEHTCHLIAAEKRGDRRTMALMQAKIEECSSLLHLIGREGPEFTEIIITEKEEGPEAVQFLSESFQHMFFALHEKELLRPREQWTIPLGTGCGFIAEIRLRTSSLGTCALDGVRPDVPADSPPPPSAWNDGRPHD